MGEVRWGNKIFVHPPLYPLPSREGQFDIGYPAARCREVHLDC